MSGAESFGFDRTWWTLTGQILDAYQHLESILAEDARQIPGSSRFAQYRRLIENREALGEVDPRLAHALCECAEVAHAARVLEACGVEGWVPLVVELLSGPALPSASNSSEPRDKQLELVAAAALAEAGLPVLLAEPDIVTSLGGTKYGLAVKRPRSRSRLRKTVRKAEKQLCDAGLSGVLLIDISCLANPGHDFMLAHTVEKAMEYLDSRIAPFDAYVLPGLRRFLEGDQLLGVISICALVGRFASPAAYGSVTRVISTPLLEAEDHRTDIIAELTRKLGAGLSGR